MWGKRVYLNYSKVLLFFFFNEVKVDTELILNLFGNFQN